MIKINKVVKTLIYSDFLLQSGWGLIGPIFAIFLTNQIKGGSLAIVGIVAAVFWITKSIIQPFVAHQMDKNHGEKDDLIYLIVGMYVANLIPLGYIFASQPWHIYVLEFIRAIAMAAVYPAWTAIFTRHVDKGREAFSWSLESSSLGIAAGIASVCGAWLASVYGFKNVFVLVSVFGLLSSSVLLLIRKSVFVRDGFAPRLPPTEKPF